MQRIYYVVCDAIEPMWTGSMRVVLIADTATDQETHVKDHVILGYAKIFMNVDMMMNPLRNIGVSIVRNRPVGEIIKSARRARIKNRNLKMRVVFNVGGKRFETSVSTIVDGFSEPRNDLLDMLLRHKIGDQTEVFIDRDPASFQGILNIYRGSGTLTTDPTELDFYGIPQKPMVVKEKTKREEIEDVLIDYRQRQKRLKQKETEEHYNVYAAILKLLLDHGGKFLLVYADSMHDFSSIPSTIDGVSYPESYFCFLDRESFKSYAAKLGYKVQYQREVGSKATKFEHPPASLYNGSYTNRKKTCITLTLSVLM